MIEIALLTSAMSHGAHIITGSPDRYVDGLPVPGLTDIVYCPIHGVNSIISVTITQETDNLRTAHVNAIAACGAIIISGSTNCYVG